jgi:hypothetical protein
MPHLIDPPVGPYSEPAAIREWIRELAKLPQNEIEVQEAIAEAQGWLFGGHRLWGRAIRELQDGRPDRILEAIARLPVPSFARKFLADLASAKRAPQKKSGTKGGRPAKRPLDEELELVDQVVEEWLRLLQAGEPDSQAKAIKIVSDRHPEESPGSLRRIVEKHHAQYAPIMKSIGKLKQGRAQAARWKERQRK